MCHGVHRRQPRAPPSRRHPGATACADAGHVRLGTIESITERGTFDGIVALDVIEHIEDDYAALVRLREALAPNGTLV